MNIDECIHKSFIIQNIKAIYIIGLVTGAYSIGVSLISKIDYPTKIIQLADQFFNQ